MEKGNPPRRYYTLDAMRGIAALEVVIYHLTEGRVQVFPFGYLAVDFFFMLSGFVIAQSYEHRLHGNLPFARYAEMRLIRLYPLYALGLLLGFAVVALTSVLGDGTMQPLRAFGTNLFLLPSFVSGMIYPFNPPHWSLLMEIIVSLLFGLVLFRLSSTMLRAIALASLLALYLTIDSAFDLNVGWEWPNFSGGLLRATFAFSLGIVAARTLHDVAIRRTWLVIVPCIALPGIMLVSRSLVDPITFGMIVLGLILPVLLIAGAVLEPPAAWNRSFSFLGNISYPAYAIHQPLMVLALAIAVRIGIPFPIAAIAFVVGLIAASWMAARFYDEPARRWISRLRQNNRSVRPVAFSPTNTSSVE